MRRAQAAKSLRIAFALAAVLVVAGGGCANLIGLDDYEEVDGNCDVGFLPGACRSCISAKCSDECGDCRGNPACVALLECLKDCNPNENCLTTCEEEHPKGVNDFFSVFADNGCAFTTCEDDCSVARAEGAPCDRDGQCALGTCLGTDGWCSRVCVDSSDCAPGMFCIPTQADESFCFVGCDGDADCSAYPKTSCLTGSSTDGAEVSVCALG